MHVLPQDYASKTESSMKTGRDRISQNRLHPPPPRFSVPMFPLDNPRSIPYLNFIMNDSRPKIFIFSDQNGRFLKLSFEGLTQEDGWSETNRLNNCQCYGQVQTRMR